MPPSVESLHLPPCAGSVARAADRSIGAHSDPALLSWRGEEVEVVERRRSWRLALEESLGLLDILAARDRLLPAQVGGRPVREVELVLHHHPAAHMAALCTTPNPDSQFPRSWLLRVPNFTKFLGELLLVVELVCSFLLKIFGPRTPILCLLSVP